MPLQRLRAEFIKGFTRDDRNPSSKAFSPFRRATILGWLSQDLYGPSAFLSSRYASKAIDIWCDTALTKSDPQHIPFTLAFLTPELIDAIGGCTNNFLAGQALVLLRDRGLSQEDALRVFEAAIIQGLNGGPPPSSDEIQRFLNDISLPRRIVDANLRVMRHVAAAIYADVSLTERTIVAQISRLCVESWLP
jgi:hypothetical protein